MPCCIEPVGGEIDEETRGDAQTTEREIQVGARRAVVTVAAATADDYGIGGGGGSGATPRGKSLSGWTPPNPHRVSYC